MNLLKRIARVILTGLFRVEVRGDVPAAGLNGPVLIVANHTSFLDALLLWAFLPQRLTFAVNTRIAQRWYMRWVARVVECFPMDPTSPLALRALVRRVEAGQPVAIFPEGRVTVTGSLMKVYQGPAMVAVHTGAQVLPVGIDGPQHSVFGRLRAGVPRRWCPRVRVVIGSLQRLRSGETQTGRDSRAAAARELTDLLAEVTFAARHSEVTLTARLMEASRLFGPSRRVAEDAERRPVSYRSLLVRSAALGGALRPHTRLGETVAVLLPNSVPSLVSFWALQIEGRVPAMLNFTLGAQAMASACATARVRTVVTSRRFIEMAGLEQALAILGASARVVFLEDLAAAIGLGAKLQAMVGACLRFPRRGFRARAADDAAVVLFTSGSESAPKGVVLSHANVSANIEQLSVCAPFLPSDVALNALPMFHSFGLTAGTLMPLLKGMKTFLYPSPLHYRVIPELAYDIGATVLFGTNTFLAGYARVAHPYDFQSLRHVFAGAEPLRDSVREAWIEKFGIRVLEGYGATETSPVIAANSPLAYRPASVGRFLPAMRYRLERVAGVGRGGRLHVRGPNVMLGYLLAERPGELVRPASRLGVGWYDTGDIVEVDDAGFVRICGRAKRFAKVGGEMISLSAIEALAARVWPEGQHAAVAVADTRKGEQVVLLTDLPGAQRADLAACARREGMAEICLPRAVVSVKALPILGTGKVDYATAAGLAREVA
ncbi:MAG: hypothetical protein AMJ69_00060 [Gammaproteobacteria bacterium SG8_47]|nr:MAG: hypothetical protein AMJ69_00060 [Gammaproteobacteria bacterium SG8_47]